MSANEHDDDQPDSFEVIERLRARVAKLEETLEDVLKFSNDPGVIRFVRAALKGNGEGISDLESAAGRSTPERQGGSAAAGDDEDENMIAELRAGDAEWSRAQGDEPAPE